MKRMFFVCVMAAAGIGGQASGQILGAAQEFAVLGATTVTNTGLSVVSGSLGVWPGTAVTGFPPGVVMDGTIYPGGGVAQQAQNDAAVAYNALAAMAMTQDLTGMDLGGMTLTPGVYSFSSSAFLTGTLTLDAMGDPNAMFVFQTGSTLITASDASVITINGADACEVYWQVGSSATLGTGTIFQGSILALTSITMTTGASLMEGRAIALNGAVTMDTNMIIGACIPAPGASLLFGTVLVGTLSRRRRK